MRTSVTTELALVLDLVCSAAVYGQASNSLPTFRRRRPQQKRE